MNEVKSMGFSEAVRTCLDKYATFKGRARRSEYWYFYLFYCIAAIVLNAVGSSSSYGAGISIVRLILSLFS